MPRNKDSNNCQTVQRATKQENISPYEETAVGEQNLKFIKWTSMFPRPLWLGDLLFNIKLKNTKLDQNRKVIYFFFFQFG